MGVDSEGTFCIEHRHCFITDNLRHAENTQVGADVKVPGTYTYGRQLSANKVSSFQNVTVNHVTELSWEVEQRAPLLRGRRGCDIGGQRHGSRGRLGGVLAKVDFRCDDAAKVRYASKK